MSYNLLDAYDDATAANRRTGFGMYCGHPIGMAAEDGQVRVWLQRDTDVEHCFNVHHRSPHELLSDVDDFLNSSA
jgi:hypothetical protein